MVATMEAPTANRRQSDQTPRSFDPAAATFVHEVRIRERWQQEYACPSSREGRAPHRLHLDKSGTVIGCSCEGYYFARAGKKECEHSRQALAIIAAATARELAALDDEGVSALAAQHRRLYGTAGLADNPRADLVADELAARLFRRNGHATIALGRMAVADLFSEAG